MKVVGFQNPANDGELLDMDTVHTIPDLSLSVRDILERFTRGQMELPSMDEGEDEDIDAPDFNFDDPVDALDALQNGLNVQNRVLNHQSIKEPTKPQDAGQGESTASDANSVDAVAVAQ